MLHIEALILEGPTYLDSGLTTLALHYLRLGSQSPSRSPGDTATDKALASTTTSRFLVIVSSLTGYIDDTHSSAYTASKFGSRGLFRAIRAQAHAQLNIPVNTICPWAMKTPMIEGALNRMAEFGILPDKGITLVPHDVLTQALARVAVDEGISGRAIAIVPEGAVDIGDDINDGYGGTRLVELMALRKEAGDLLYS